MKHPPKPESRPDTAGLIDRIRRFRRDIFASQPDRLYDAKMAELRTPLYRSFLVNDPTLVDLVLSGRPDSFPKSSIIADTLHALLGKSVFVTNGETWKRQRRIIDPAFAGGRLQAIFPAMVAAGAASVARFGETRPGDPVDIEPLLSQAAADVIFRTLFSVPIEEDLATKVFDAFRHYQRSAPLLSPLALMRAPAWVPRLRNRQSHEAAHGIRHHLRALVDRRMTEIARGAAPDDLATAIMTGIDPESGTGFTREEVLDQIAIFFLAGHETSASALAWAMYLLATHSEVQDRIAAEAQSLPITPAFSDLRRLGETRNVFRETLRLYPPVPMMVRETAQEELLRNRKAPRRSLVILSPWHLHRHRKLWETPDEFRPERWAEDTTRSVARKAYIPFSAGPRVCTGAGFAMMEGVLLIAMLTRAFRFTPVADREPVPIAHLTVRAKDGIWLHVAPL